MGRHFLISTLGAKTKLWGKEVRPCHRQIKSQADMVAPSILKLSILVAVGVCIFSSWSSASPTGLFDPKRSGSRGFHEGIFDEGFGGFSTLKKKRRPEMGKNGMHGDAFTGGFGDFYTMKRSGFNNEFLLAKLLRYMEDEQMRSHDY